MYTKTDLIENQKMDEIIKENYQKTTEFNKKRAKKEWKDKIITNILMTIASSTFAFGLMFLVSVIENLRF